MFTWKELLYRKSLLIPPENKEVEILFFFAEIPYLSLIREKSFFLVGKVFSLRKDLFLSDKIPKKNLHNTNYF